MATVSAPVFEGEALRGTISVDVSMTTLASRIAESVPKQSSARLLDPRGGDMLDQQARLWPKGPKHTGVAPPTAADTELDSYPLPSGWTLQVLTPRSALWRLALVEALPSGLLLLLVFIGTAAVLALRRSLLTSQHEVERFVRETEEQNLGLLAAREQADRANRAKSDFVATISHEIRNPLTGVIGLAANLADEDDIKRVRAGLQVLHQSAESLRSVLNDVLDFTKLEAGALELEQLPFDAGTAMRAIVELMRARAAEQQTKLEAVIDPSVPPWVRGDPTRFRQIVLNLVSNAVKFTEAGKVTCSLRAADGRLVLSVSDTGIGMSPAQQERLFAPWAQAERSTARRFGGSGLGLSIVRRLVDAMGGAITLQSEVGKGSTFTVSFPAEASAAPARPEPAPEGVARSLRVLLVDDNPVNRLVFTRLLEKLGHQVKTETNGEKALEHLSREGFDIVLMDCHMPVMDGFDATRKLRERGERVPVVALTGAVTQEERDRCFAAGMNGFVAKPADARALREVLASVAP